MGSDKADTKLPEGRPALHGQLASFPSEEITKNRVNCDFREKIAKLRAANGSEQKLNCLHRAGRVHATLTT